MPTTKREKQDVAKRATERAVRSSYEYVEGWGMTVGGYARQLQPRSTGEIVAYLNSDDLYRPGAFATVRRAFEENESLDVVVGDCDIINDKSVTVGKYESRLDASTNLRK